MTDQPIDSVRIVLFDGPDLERFFVVQETDDPSIKLPGGKLEGTETPDEAKDRELKEELGTKIRLDTIVKVGDLLNDDGVSARHIYAGILDGTVEAGEDIAKVDRTTLESIPEGKNQQHMRSAAKLALDALRNQPK